MLPDVAVGNRAQHGVRHRVQHDVGVGVAEQGAVMGNADATEPDVVAVGEGVDVETGSDACLHAAMSFPVLGGAPHVLRRRQLHVGGCALDDVTAWPAHSITAASSVSR